MLFELMILACSTTGKRCILNDFRSFASQSSGCDMSYYGDAGFN